MSTTMEDESLRKNYGYLVIGILLAFMILLSKIWYLQIIKGGEFSDAADSNRTRTIRLAAPRGVVRDREGRVLVDNRPSFDVYFHPLAIKGKTEDESRSFRLRYLEKIASEMDVDFSLLKKRFNQAAGKAPIKVKTDITWEEVARINAASVTVEGHPPLRVEDETKRVYPFGKLLCHFIGYVAEIDQKRLDSPNYVGYRPGDLVGKVGLEDRYETDLKGAFGRKVIEENARNVELRNLDIMPPIPGKNLVLNVDIDLVKAAERAMRAMNNQSGAVVALDVHTGGVLCALSLPGYNPEIFSRVLSKDTWNGLLNDEKKPLANKVIGNAYPPGSTWKLVTAIAGLESGEIKKSWIASCAGRWKYGDRSFRCWNEHGHGTTNLHRAIVRSCDVFFYKLSLKVGIDKIGYWAELLGAGAKTGIDATPETRGTVPSREWKLNTIGEEWIAGETLSCAIGQGYNLVSPLQLALIYASVANGGTVYRPQMVDRIEDPDGNLVEQIEPEVIRQVQFKKDTLPPIIRGLTGVVNEMGGTGTKSKLKNVLVAGKTGTAQVRRIHKVRKHISNMKWEARDHAWFAAFAPAENPEIAVVVLAEHSGHGGTAAAPVAGAVLGEYFRKKARAATAPPGENPETTEESN